MHERLGAASLPWLVLRAVDPSVPSRAIVREILVFRKQLSKNLAAHGGTFIGDRWEVVNVGEFDSDGPQIQDLNGDGSAELVGKDDSFDYAFASYAESYAPPKILRLVGSRIADVSSSSEFQRPILQMLLANEGLATPEMWRDNGFLAGWVAHNALVGSGRDAWRRMLNLYNRNSDWDLSVCTIPTNPCPENAKRFRDFPTALREHLAKNGYSLDGIVGASAGSISPSFDCNKARTPSEIGICRSPRLAELDNILAAGYAFIKKTQGRPAADVIGIPYWNSLPSAKGTRYASRDGSLKRSPPLRRQGRQFPCQRGHWPPRAPRSPRRLLRLRQHKRRRPRNRMPHPSPNMKGRRARASSSPQMAPSSRMPTSSRTAEPSA